MTLTPRLGGGPCQHFNPHEREARDAIVEAGLEAPSILIHTSVKLVTGGLFSCYNCIVILIHTSVKLVTRKAMLDFLIQNILIHTSVKLVTTEDLTFNFGR